MAVFRRSSKEPARPARSPRFREGRLLRSDLEPDACRDLLEDLIGFKRARRYPELPHVVPAGLDWSGEPTGAPGWGVAFDDLFEEFNLVAFTPGDSGSSMALHQVGSHVEDLRTFSILGPWKQRDPSLTSVGTAPGGVLGLAPPPITEELLASTAAFGGFPATAHNSEVIASQMAVLFLLKARQAPGLTDPRAFQAFETRQARQPGESGLAVARRVLDALCQASPNSLPYLQDLPLRVRAIMCESHLGGSTAMWGDLEAAEAAEAAEPAEPGEPESV